MMFETVVIAALMAAGGLELIAAERLGSGATIPLSTNGAFEGDILIVVTYQAGSFTVSGSGWTQASGCDTVPGAFVGAHAFKTLTDNTDVTTSGAPNGFFYCVVRGFASAALVVGPSVDLTATRNVAFPTPSATAGGALIITGQQFGADLTAPADWTDEGYFVGTQCYNLFTLDPAPATSHVARRDDQRHRYRHPMPDLRVRA